MESIVKEMIEKGHTFTRIMNLQKWETTDITEHYNKLFKPVYNEIDKQQKKLNDIKHVAFDLANNL